MAIDRRTKALGSCCTRQGRWPGVMPGPGINLHGGELAATVANAHIISACGVLCARVLRFLLDQTHQMALAKTQALGAQSARLPDRRRVPSTRCSALRRLATVRGPQRPAAFSALMYLGADPKDDEAPAPVAAAADAAAAAASDAAADSSTAVGEVGDLSSEVTALKGR